MEKIEYSQGIKDRKMVCDGKWYQLWKRIYTECFLPSRKAGEGAKETFHPSFYQEYEDDILLVNSPRRQTFRLSFFCTTVSDSLLIGGKS